MLAVELLVVELVVLLIVALFVEFYRELFVVAFDDCVALLVVVELEEVWFEVAFAVVLFVLLVEFFYRILLSKNPESLNSATVSWPYYHDPCSPRFISSDWVY